LSSLSTWRRGVRSTARCRRIGTRTILIARIQTAEDDREFSLLQARMQPSGLVMYLDTVGLDAPAERVRDEPTRLEALYRQHVPRVTRVAYLLVGDINLAYDLAHDAFIRTSGKLYTLKSPEAFGSYITRTVINLCKRHRQRHYLEQRHLREEIVKTPRYTYQPDVGATDEVVREMRALPHRQRTALVLRFYADLSEAQIAEVLGCPVGTVKSLISRGLAKLRERLGSQ
jgi:RNA polymerase sigma-70 factor (sigma-E family)